MKPLFKAKSKDQEDSIRKMLKGTLLNLRGCPDDDVPYIIVFDGFSAGIIADMVEIGAAPDSAPISSDMRKKVKSFGQVRLQMNHEFSNSFADLLESGICRHENGVENPYAFTLH
jgi:hypothetical protein